MNKIDTPKKKSLKVKSNVKAGLTINISKIGIAAIRIGIGTTQQ